MEVGFTPVTLLPAHVGFLQVSPLLKNVPVLSEAFWNKPVDRVLLGVSYAWWF